ncbi:MAG: 50S ribosomal protein L11 methyltransferase [Candidatus Thermoplasmatota archaeon]|nr:50S ribosomal protein L11 methyltransferase [Candidatus Thermoplasmatota archaeon]
MGAGEISREVEYSSSVQSKVHDFKINEKNSIKLIVPPTVYPPRRDTKLLLKGLERINLQAGNLVEIGCGSGAISIAKALEGWNVTAFDVNPLAVVATKGNSEVAGVNHRVTVEEGGVGEEHWKLPTDTDLVVWNLPYLTPDLENTLGPMEEAALTDERLRGWSELLLNLANEESQNGTIFVLLMNSDSNPKNSPLTWIRKGWSKRSLAVEIVGDDTLEVIAFWRPGFGSEPTYLEETNSTMDEARNLPKFGWQRIRSGEQISGRGRKGTIWHSNQGDMIASWSVKLNELNRMTPGLLQVSIGASICEALGVQMKWPNDLIWQGKKCGGILLESGSYDGTIRIGVGLNKNGGEIEGFSYAGWTEYIEEIESNEMFQIIDAALGSILDSTPPIDPTENTIWQQKSWAKLCEILSTGVVAKFDGRAVNIFRLYDTGSLGAYSDTKAYEISDIDDFSITF